MKRSISHPGTYNYERYTMFTQHTDFLFSVQTAYAVIFRVAINAGAVSFKVELAKRVHGVAEVHPEADADML